MEVQIRGRASGAERTPGVSKARWVGDRRRGGCSDLRALVANVVQHSPGPIRASLNCVGNQVALHVEDDGDLFALEPHLPHSMLSEGGRGLYIAAQCATALRVESRHCGGKVVIAVLPEKRRLYLV